MDVLIQDIKLNSDNRIEKILVFELIALAMIDGNIAFQTKLNKLVLG